MIEGPRAARGEELPAVVELSNGVFYPDGRFDMARMFPTLYSTSNVGNLRVCVDDGRPVALSGMTVRDLRIDEVVIRAACIGSVCTRGEYRGRGLAARLMEDCLSAASAQGASLAMVSGDRSLYRRMGCADAGLFDVIRVLRDSSIPRASCRVREWVESDLPELETLHGQERVRFERSPGEMLTLLRTGAVHCRPGRTWIVAESGRTAGYLCIESPDDRTGPVVMIAREIAGARPAILAAAHAILDASGAECLDIEVPASEAGMVALSRSCGCAVRRSGMHGTLKIIDPPAFLEALKPRLEARLSLGDRSVFTNAMAQVSAPADLAAFAFGSVENTPSPPGGSRGDILRAVFPLPLPVYGLNYT